MRKSIITTILFFLVFVTYAQNFTSIKSENKPLILKSFGSFYEGGENVEQSSDELGSFGPGGHISINQMYVHYMIPAENKVPFVLIHGMALTGKCWETTPDGRMGWDEYFVRQGHGVYVIDQVGRGRSGFNQANINKVRTGAAQNSTLPILMRFSDEVVWRNFRIGSDINKPFPNEQFPIEAMDALSIQGVPDLTMSLPFPNPTYKALSDLAEHVDGAILLSHSQSGSFPLEAALVNPKGIKGIVMVEPGMVSTSFRQDQLDELAKIPILIVFGDNLEIETGIPNFSWKVSYDNCLKFKNQINAIGGNAKVIHLPEIGILGNSHMIMQDKNNLEIADIILNWQENNK